MASALYAEIYLLCIVIVGLCRYWSMQRSSYSASERWLNAMIGCFMLSFISNLLFTLFNSILPRFFATYVLTVGFKTLYHIFLCMGVFGWCGYADTECRGTLFTTRSRILLTSLPLFGMAAWIIANLWTHQIFQITEEGAYTRARGFQLELILLILFTTFFSVKLLIQSLNESDPIKRGHERLVASFPLSLFISLALSRMGEAVPIICVAITLELLCLYMGTSTQQISLDKLTQVNNRQNLLGFLDYKLVNHDEKLFLLMMDLDYFKVINDSYGHLEGDDALVRAAKALKQACGSFKRRPYIARYGGDEFIVVIESSKAEADMLVALIREKLEEQNNEAHRPYTLAFSIGMAEFHPGMNANDLIEAADHCLYEVKRARPPRKF